MKPKIAIFGTGTIGACQATLLSGNGYPTIVIGHSEAGMSSCKKTIEENWNHLISADLATCANKNAAMALVTITNDPMAMKGSEIIFEAVAEEIAVKKEVYSQITRYCGAEVITASTTSSIDATILAKLIKNPTRFLIAHPFQPVHMLPLVEVVRHDETSDETVSKLCALLKDLNRQVVILNKSVPGFIINRFAQALFRESIYLIEEGVTTAEDIDKAVKYAIGMRYASIGLLEYFDAVGFELESTIAKNVYPDLCNTPKLQKTVLAGLALGQTGQKAGKGLYDWSQKDSEDFQLRMQSPYFYSVKKWTMPK